MGLSVKLELAFTTSLPRSCLLQGFPVSISRVLGLQSGYHALPAFIYVGSKDPNSGPFAYTASILLSQLPLKVTFK